MTTIELDATQIMAFHRLCRQHDIDIPAEPIDPDEWIEAQLESEDGWDDHASAAEHFPHETAMERLLYELGNACPICGDPECEESVAYVGAQPIHSSQHPENKRPTARRF